MSLPDAAYQVGGERDLNFFTRSSSSSGVCVPYCNFVARRRRSHVLTAIILPPHLGGSRVWRGVRAHFLSHSFSRCFKQGVALIGKRKKKKKKQPLKMEKSSVRLSPCWRRRWVLVLLLQEGAEPAACKANWRGLSQIITFSVGQWHLSASLYSCKRCCFFSFLFFKNRQKSRSLRRSGDFFQDLINKERSSLCARTRMVIQTRGYK